MDEFKTSEQVPWAMITHICWALRLDEKHGQQIGMVVAAWAKGMFVCSDIFERCESPMERVFLLSTFLAESDALEFPRNERGTLVCRTKSGKLFIRPQHEIWDYEDESDAPIARADFLVGLESETGQITSAVLVEIDGHEFHEKTKEQAASDKARDRKITRLGHRMLRFTGSEVYASPANCLREVISALDGIRERDDHRLECAVDGAFDAGFREGCRKRETPDATPLLTGAANDSSEPSTTSEAAE